MAEHPFSIARLLCEFLGQPEGACRLVEGELQVDARGRAPRALLALVGRVCRARDLYLVQWRQEGPGTVRALLAWRDEQGEPCFLALRMRSARDVKAWLGALLSGRRSIGFFGAGAGLRAGVLERARAALAPAFRGDLALRASEAGPRSRFGGPDFWVMLDAPAEAGERYRRDLRAAEHTWNATTVDASRGAPAAANEAVWTILRCLEGRLEFRYPELHPEPNPLLARLLLEACRRRTPLLSKLMKTLLNCDLYPKFWSPVLLAHPYCIVMHVRTRIGRHVTIMQGVTLGAKDRGINAAPILEDDVYVGAGAKILGGARIGRGASVGANAVVTRDVPPGATVVGSNRIVRAAAATQGR